MTRRHFNKMAATFKADRPDNAETHALEAWRKLVAAFITIAEDTNPRFDSKRFWEACGGI